VTWCEATLADVARWSSGGTPQARNAAYYGGAIPWAVIGDLSDGPVRETASTITKEGLANSSAKIVPAGTVLVAMYGSIGKLGITTAPMATNQAIATAVPNGVVDARFLFWYLASQRKQLDAAGKGAAQRNISQSILKPWPIRFPDRLVEQQRIVEILESHLSRLDSADQLLQRSAHAASAMLLSFLAAERRETLAGAELRRIGEFSQTCLGKMLDAKRQTGEPTPYLRNINVRWGRFDLSDIKTTSLTDKDRERLRLHPGDVLICEGGEPGRCAVWPEGGPTVAFQKALHRVRVLEPEKVLPHYISLMLREATQSGRLDRMFTGTTIKHLPQERLRRIELALPSPQIQRQIVERGDAVSQSADRLQSEIVQTTHRAQQLHRAVLAAAFSGRLTGKSTDNEAIEELAE